MTNFKYNIGDKVTIKDLGNKGVIISLWFGRHGEEYQVRYCYNGKFEEVYLFDWEIEAIG